MSEAQNGDQDKGFIVNTTVGDVLVTRNNSTLRLFKTGLIDRIDVDSPDGRIFCLFASQQLILELHEAHWPCIDSRPFTISERDIAIAEEHFRNEIDEAIENDLWEK